MKLRYRIILCLICLPAYLYAEVPADFDSDGISEVVYISGSSLVWKATGSQSHTEELSKSFGLDSDALALGHWIDPSIPSLGIVRASAGSRQLTWKILRGGLISEAAFGRRGDLVLAGGDYDADGITDAAVVRVSKKRLHWNVQQGLFLSNPSKLKSFNLGVYGDRAFFVSADGGFDYAAVFGPSGKSHSRLIIKNVNTGQTSSFKNFPRALSRGQRPRPIPIAQASGADLLAFVTTDATDTTVAVYDLNANLVSKTTFPGLGTIFIGEYIASAPGQEIAFQSGTSVTFFNPATSAQASQSSVNGTPVDEINITPLG